MQFKYNQRWVGVFCFFKQDKWAVTIGQTAYFTCPEEDVSAAWKRHELTHMAQWKQNGRMRFMVKYIYYHFKHGYENNPFEVQARKAETL